jgi:multidrug efflux pump subunit AcrA (membrane-fusion protein)
MMRRPLIAGAAVVILGMVVAGCLPAWGPAAKQAAAKPALPPATTKVATTTLVDTRALPGTLGYGDAAPISATGLGKLTWIAPVGSTVKRGEPLFKVDDRPVVALYGSVPLYRTLQPGTMQTQTVPTPQQLRVEQAEASLRLARLRLDQLRQGPRPEEIAAAEATVRAAMAKLTDLQAGSPPQDVAQALAAVDSAASGVRSAQAQLAAASAKLAALLDPRPEDLAGAESQVRSAQARLQQLLNPRAEDVKAAQAQLASAQAKLQALTVVRVEDLAVAQSQLDLAKTKLAQFQDQPRTANPNDLANAQLAVQQAQVAYDKALADSGNVGKSGGPSTQAAADAAVKLALIQMQTAQNNLAKLQTQGPTDYDVRLAQEAVNAAQATLEKLQRPSPADLLAAQAAVDQAQASLDKLQRPSQPDVQQVQEATNQAQASLDKLKNPSPADIAAAQQGVAQAQAAVDAAQATSQAALAKLDVLTQGPKAADIQAAQSALAQAQAALALKQAPPSQLDVAQAEEQVRQAEIAQREAQRALNDGVSGADVQQLEENLAELGYTGFTVDDTYTLATAEAVRKWQADLGRPETGIVEPGQVVFTPGPVRIAEQTGRVGDTIGGGSDASAAVGSARPSEAGASGRGVPVVSYTGTTKLVTVQLGVADQALAVEGRKATVRVPGRLAVEGRISQVSTALTAAGTAPPPGGASSAAAAARIKVDVAIADQTALGALSGAPVDVDFVVEERKDVLAVPVAALVALADGGYGVEVVEGGATRIVPVKTGLFAAGRVEVSGEGIAEGVTVGIPK